MGVPPISATTRSSSDTVTGSGGRRSSDEDDTGYGSDSTAVHSPNFGSDQTEQFSATVHQHDKAAAYYSYHDSDDEKMVALAQQDIEAQTRQALPSSPDAVAATDTTLSAKTGAEYAVPASTKYLYLGLYFGLNLTLTLYNKAVLGKFAYPFLLTTIHTSTAALGCSLLLYRGHFHLTTLSRRENMLLLAYSVLYTINIAISNVSLGMVSVSFHQILRSTCPLFTVLIYRLWYARSYDPATYISLLPIVLGAALTTFGDLYCTMAGFVLTLLGVVLASLKTVATNRLMTGSLKLPALELLFRMSPLAALQSLLFAFVAGEVSAVANVLSQSTTATASSLPSPTTAHFNRSLVLALAGNGLLAFSLNIASLHTNKLAGALTMSICANLKQCMTVLLSIVLFEGVVTATSGAGMVVTLVGAAIYSNVEMRMKGHSAGSNPMLSSGGSSPRIGLSKEG